MRFSETNKSTLLDVVTQGCIHRVPGALGYRKWVENLNPHGSQRPQRC